MSDEFKRQFAILASGDAQQLQLLARETEGFPHGADAFINRHWITNAIDSGSIDTVAWMLEKNVELNFRDGEGYSPIHSALEQPVPLRYELLKLLLASKAPIDIKGVNDYTPAHMAASRDDVEALKILVEHGADLSIRTVIDDFATPLEEARNLGMVNAVKFLEGVV